MNFAHPTFQGFMFIAHFSRMALPYAIDNALSGHRMRTFCNFELVSY